MAWEKVKLGDLYEVHNGLSKGGKFFGSGYPFLSFSTVFNNWFIPQNIKDLVQSTDKEQESYSIKKGDVFITRTSETADELGMSCVALKDYPQATYNGFCKRLRPIKSNYEINPRYIGYYLRTSDFRGKFLGLSGTMTTRASLRNEDLLAMEILLPPIKEQKRIADILSAYDNLIENNQKQIKLLEEAAQRLYKQWFIDLRYPGHETTPIVDGLPEGWRKESVKDCLEMHIGGGWGKDNPDGKNTFAGKVIRGTDINDVKQGNFNDVPTRYHTANDMQKRKLAEYDIVFELSNGNINNIGRSLFVNQLLLENCGENTICASFCKLLRSKNKYLAMLLYLEIQDMQNSGRMLPYKKHGSNGINNFDFEGFLKHEFLIPSNKNILAPFFDIMKKIANIQKSFSLLIESRDRLLPKLMNGELEV